MSIIGMRAHGAAPAPDTDTPSATDDWLKHELQCLYRLGAGATMFEVRDPDPRAFDGGRVLGVRIEVCVQGKSSVDGVPSRLLHTSADLYSAGKFMSPYYLLLNRTYVSSPSLRIHKHTIPPCVPLESLKALYLPQPKSLSAQRLSYGPPKPPPTQNLPGLVRALRRELTSYHLRHAFINSIRQSLVVSPHETTPNTDDPEDPDAIVDVCAVDAEAREIKIEWGDKTLARVRIGGSGAIQDCSVHGVDGRDTALERKIRGADGRIEGLMTRLASHSQDYLSTDEEGGSGGDINMADSLVDS